MALWLHPLDLGPSGNGASASPRGRPSLSRSAGTGSIAGVATVGAAGVEVAQEVLLRWVFIAAAPGGIAVAIYARIDDWQQGRP